VSHAERQNRRRAAAVRWCTAEKPAPRPAYYDAAEAYPGLSVRLWCRLYRLMEHRGLLSDAPALRMAAYLADTDTVRRDGVISDVPAMLAGYMARCYVSKQTAYTDLGRLVRRGLVRQVQAAAPGYRARYRLAAPAAMVAASMPGLPPELARAIRQDPEGSETPRPDRRRAGDGSGSACGGLDPSPYMREGSPPSPPGDGHRGVQRRGWPCDRGEKITEEELDRARAVLKACAGEWRAQRGRGAELGELGRVEVLAMLAMRHAPPGEIIQLLTERVAGARDLAAVLAWRLGRVVDASRHPGRQVPADENGARYAEMLAARAGNIPPSSARLAAIAAAKAAADDARRRSLSSA
jgi:hypothetical protein